MGNALLVTGGSGYVGSHLLPRWKGHAWDDLLVLSRRPMANLPQGWRSLEGDLLSPERWEERLPRGLTILHLAALTGKGRRQDHLRANFEASRRLFEVARRKEASGVLLVSTVAAGFSRRAGYHYAEAKLAAEEALKRSGLPHTIVRPTMVFGPGAPVLGGLAQLAAAPLVPLFGGGHVRCQPVHVDDLARWLEFAVLSIPWEGRTLTPGGPDVVTMRELLQRIRLRLKGKSGGLLPVPLMPLRCLLQILEIPLGTALPLTAGQLASFANDSLADELSMEEGKHLLTTSLDVMLEDGLGGGSRHS